MMRWIPLGLLGLCSLVGCKATEPVTQVDVPSELLSSAESAGMAPTTLPVNAAPLPGGGFPGRTLMVSEPDQKVKGRFKLRGTEIEVVGVCRLSEDGGQCWNTKGMVDKQLTERTLARFKEGGGDANFIGRIEMYKKNRVVLARVTNSQRKFDARTTHLMTSYYSESPDAPAMNSTASNKEILLSVIGSRSDRTTQISASVVQPLGNSPDMPCKIGAEIEHDGLKLRITNIERQGSRWMITLRTSSDQKPIRSFSVTALDVQGKAIAHTDAKGLPISEEDFLERIERNRRQRESTPDAPIAAPDFRSGKPSVVKAEKDELRVATNIDPRYIDRLYFTVTKIWKIAITDIPLDPVTKSD